jgi:hypothetical protein
MRGRGFEAASEVGTVDVSGPKLRSRQYQRRREAEAACMLEHVTADPRCTDLPAQCCLHGALPHYHHHHHHSGVSQLLPSRAAAGRLPACLGEVRVLAGKAWELQRPAPFNEGKPKSMPRSDQAPMLLRDHHQPVEYCAQVHGTYSGGRESPTHQLRSCATLIVTIPPFRPRILLRRQLSMRTAVLRCRPITQPSTGGSDSDRLSETSPPS